MLLGGIGADVLDGGNGTRDRVQYNDSTGGLRIDLTNAATNTGIAAGDTFVGIEDIYGSVHSDSIFGNTGGNVLWGDAGQDLFGAGAGNDTIYGGAGNDAMGGGAGNDLMYGGTGNDIFYVDALGDQTIEVAGEGTSDNIYTTLATFSIASLLNIEFMTGISAGAQNLTGNSLNNIMAGGAASDVLSGLTGNDTIYGGAGNDVLGGGAGNDYYFGGTGNDTFYVDSLTDQIIEDVAGGTADTIAVALASYSMATKANVENLTGLLTTGQLLVGNSLSNIITGNIGADILMGGLGNDTLIGGAGADQFEFNSALGATNVDRIQSYSAADDTIRLENAIFTALTATGALAGTAFVTGAAATTAAHRIIYNSGTGQIFYDADGLGGAAQTLFAILTPATALTAADFLVV